MSALRVVNTMLVSCLLITIGWDAGATPVDGAGFSSSDGAFQTARLLASDGVRSQEFGYSVAISDELIVVGAPNFVRFEEFEQRGAVYVFARPAQGWHGQLTQVAKLLPSDGFDGDWFGRRVAIGDGFIVSTTATRSDLTDGSAYVFERPPGGWHGVLTEDARLFVSGDDSRNRFGDSLAVEGTTIAVGAPGVDSDRGAVFLFERPSGGWEGDLDETGRLLAGGGRANDSFGGSVAISGDLIVVGAVGALEPRATASPSSERFAGPGGAYVFLRPPDGWDGTHLHDAVLAPSGGQPHDGFGSGVATNGDDTIALTDGFGTALVFVRPPQGWSGRIEESARLATTDGAQLGPAVDIDGDLLLVHGAVENVDAGYLYTEPTDGWVGTVFEHAEISAPDDPTHGGQFFGDALAIRGETIVVGSWDAHVGETLFQGAAYVYTLGNGTCTPSPTVLCLDEGRFAVTVEWQSASDAGAGQAHLLTTDTGYFTFFDEANVEVVLKVLDACAPFGHHWVFAAGLTDVATEITVIDTQTGDSTIYRNALGVPFAPVQDTVAFGCE